MPAKVRFFTIKSGNRSKNRYALPDVKIFVNIKTTIIWFIQLGVIHMHIIGTYERLYVMKLVKMYSTIVTTNNSSFRLEVASYIISSVKAKLIKNDSGVVKIAILAGI